MKILIMIALFFVVLQGVLGLIVLILKTVELVRFYRDMHGRR